jgi:anti-sigma factor ChrR (cupin superfamily)
MLMCREATRLISEGLDRRLPWWQRISLRFHVMMCGACHAYKKQIESLHRLVLQKFRAQMQHTLGGHEADPMALSPEKRTQLKTVLRDASAT